VALVAHLGEGPAAAAGAAGGGGDRKRGAAAPQELGPLADELLGRLLGSFPGLLHGRALLRALLAQLQREEGDASLRAPAAPGRGAVWARTRAVVRAAADIAPAAAEALVHSFLGGGGLVPATASPPGGLGAAGKGRATLLPALNAGGDAGAANTGVAREAAAGQAALRRAADLLTICGAARAAGAAGAGGTGVGVGGGSSEGTLALARKLHYSGFVRGLVSQALAARGAGGGADEWEEPSERQATAVREVGFGECLCVCVCVCVRAWRG
jgi:hypothetical protein